MDSQSTAQPVIHGDADNGFIVEHHDGETHRTHGCMAGSENEAIDAARRKWREDDEAGGDEPGGESEHADAKRLNRADVEAMLAERDGKIADLQDRLEVQEARITELDDALSGVVAKPDAPLAVSDPGPTVIDDPGGYPGARRPPPEPTLGEQLEQQRASRIAGDPATDPEYEAFKRDRALRNKPGTSPPPP